MSRHQEHHIVSDSQQIWQGLHQSAIDMGAQPVEMLRALTILEQAHGLANAQIGVITDAQAQTISVICENLREGTRSGRNTDAAIKEAMSALVKTRKLSPQDKSPMHANHAYATALHMATVLSVMEQVLPAAQQLCATLAMWEATTPYLTVKRKTFVQNGGTIDVANTILGWRSLLEKSCHLLQMLLPMLAQLDIESEATQGDAPKGYGQLVCTYINDITGANFVSSINKAPVLTHQDTMVTIHGALKSLGCHLMQIAKDLRCLPVHCFSNCKQAQAMETMDVQFALQCNMVSKTAIEIIGNDASISAAASMDGLQTDVFLHVSACHFMESVHLLAQCMDTFHGFCGQSFIHAPGAKAAFANGGIQ